MNDYVYHVGSPNQAGDYKSTTDSLIKYIKQKSKYASDIGDTLEKGERKDTDNWRPTLRWSSDKTDPTEQDLENEQYEKEFEIEFAEYLQRLQIYEDNLIKAYSILWERCSRTMQGKIECMAAFEKEIRNNPIGLLKAIKQHALGLQEHRYPMRIITDVMKNFFNTRQKENERLDEFATRFKASRDLMTEQLGGVILMPKYVKTMPDYDENDEDKIKKCEEEAFEALTAYIFMENADQAKYGLILKGLHAQRNSNHSQYPKTLADAVQLLKCSCR